MKKKWFCILTVALLAFAGVCAGIGTAYAEQPAAAYEVKDFTEVPTDDWQICPQSDAGNATVSVNQKDLVIASAGSGTPANYYGAMSIINPGAEYENFTFELVFRVENAADSDRWLGVVYRTQSASDASPVTGYIMNYRVNGKNAYSAVNAGKGFQDAPVIDAGGALEDGTTTPLLGDGKYHTITVTMEGQTAKHFIDGHLVRTAPASDKDAHLGGAHERGGFALIMNRMTLRVKSCKITTEVHNPMEPIPPIESTGVDNTLVNTYQNENIKIVNAPTVVAEVTDAATLASLTAGARRPSNAVLHFNKDCNVVDKNGDVLDSFANVYASLDHTVIPVLNIQDKESAAAAIDFLTGGNGIDILDLAVLSPNPALIAQIKTANSKIRGIVEYREDDFGNGTRTDLYNLVALANRSCASVAVIPQSRATVENVRYLQGRFKTVWVKTGDTELDLRNAVNSGAYGIVVSDFATAYTVLESYDENAFVRMPFNVGHRGLNSGGYNENSVSCIRAAIAGGATHLEVDVHLTKDNRILVMHDDTLARTTTCTDPSVRIGDLTLEEIRSRYTLLHNNEQIPVLEDIFDVLQEHKDVVLVLELKAGTQIAQRIAALLGTGEGQYNVKDQLVIISFASDFLASLKNVLPDVPTALLKGTANKSTLSVNLAEMGACNTVLDISYGATDTEYDRAYLRDRGIMGWYWTFNNSVSLSAAVDKGHIGLTNDVADTMRDTVYKVTGKEATKASLRTGANGTAVSLVATTYSGKTKNVQGVVSYFVERGNYWDVIATYVAGGKRYYTQAFVIHKQTAEPHEHTYSGEWSNSATHHWHAATCEHTAEVGDKAEHTMQNGSCSVCGYKAVMPPAEHEHTYSSEWSNSATHHWHAATCEHTAEVSDNAEHTMENGSCSVCGYKTDDTEPVPQKVSCGCGGTVGVSAGATVAAVVILCAGMWLIIGRKRRV